MAEATQAKWRPGVLAALGAAALLAGCEIPGVWPDPKVVAREAESRAIGSACRHALRGVEDCYVLNPKAQKAAVFAGWKEMDAYMRENKIEGQKTTASAEKEEIISEPVKPASASKDKGSATEPKRAGTKT